MKTLTKILFLVVPAMFFAQQGKSYQNTVTLNDSPENVWNAMTDFTTFSIWDTGVVDVRCKDGLEKSNRCHVILANGQIIETEIVDLKENESYTVRYKLSSGNLYIQRAIKNNGSLELTETVWYKGLSKKTFEKYKGADYNESLKQRLTDFKKYVEEDLASTNK